jgi:predicted nucleic acid-binding Zn ribbon protein
MKQPEINPYAAPEALYQEPVTQKLPDVVMREEHLQSEKNIQSIGQLMILGAILLTLSVPGINAFISQGRLNVFSMSLLIGTGVLAIAHLPIGIGLVRLRRWARRPAIYLSVLWLLAFPVGTIIAVAAIGSLIRGKAAVVFSEEYHEIIQRTPQVRLRTSGATWFIAVVLLAVLVFLLFLGLA